MSINKLIIDTLKPLAPVGFQTYTGTAETYITFFFYDENAALIADDVELKTNYYLQIDVWSKSDYTSLVDQVKNKLIALGFARRSAVDFYEKDTKTFHKAMRFSYVQ
jgi:hypothetical protein